jgi:DNA-binding transcriptional MerR regulator
MASATSAKITGKITATPTATAPGLEPAPPDGVSYSIQDAARLTGVTPHTLRWYDRIGLVPGLERTATGRRQFTSGHLRWVVLLRTLRTTGMPVAKLRELTEHRQRGSVEPMQKMIHGHRAQIIIVLHMLHNSLTVLDEIERELRTAPYGVGSAW